MSPASFDAVILAGGGSSRLGGVDKMLLRVGSDRLIDRALTAVAGADRRVIVGPERPVTQTVIWTREVPPGGGPVAGLAAGLPLVQASTVVVLAADLPFVGAPDVRRLLAALDDDRDAHAGVLLVDRDGRDQLLLGAWRTDALRAVLPEEPAGLGLRRVLAPLAVRRLPAGDETLDCDTPADVARARRIAAEAGPTSREGPRA